MKYLLVNTSVDFGVTDQPLIRCSEFVRYWGKSTVHDFFVYFEKEYDPVRRKEL
jgi:hypothetical protein